MGDLPSDILLFYLTTVPLPKKEEIVHSTSPLPNLMKQMLVPSYLNRYFISILINTILFCF